MTTFFNNCIFMYNGKLNVWTMYLIAWVKHNPLTGCLTKTCHHKGKKLVHWSKIEGRCNLGLIKLLSNRFANWIVWFSNQWDILCQLNNLFSNIGNFQNMTNNFVRRLFLDCIPVSILIFKHREDGITCLMEYLEYLI